MENISTSKISNEDYESLISKAFDTAFVKEKTIVKGKVISVENMNSGNSYGNDTTSGMTAGLGYNHEIAGGVSVRAEVTVSEFGDVKTTNGNTNKNEIKVEDMIGARGTISIVKSF